MGAHRYAPGEEAEREQRAHEARVEQGVPGALLADLREAGWSVAAHNDYRLNGESHTFWLFTHPSGRWVKGEGRSDEIALTAAARDAFDSSTWGSSDRLALVLMRNRDDAELSLPRPYREVITSAISGEPPLSAGLADVLSERQKQIRIGFTAENDDGHDLHQLGNAAVTYLLAFLGFRKKAAIHWHFAPERLKETTPRRFLVKALAVGLAELERIDRRVAREGGEWR